MSAASDSRLRTFIRAAASSEADDLESTLQRTAALAKEGVSLAAMTRASRSLGVDHAAVLSAQAITGRRRMEPSPDAERAELRALRKWFVTSAASLGLPVRPPGEEDE
jgi:hypothetical protein